MTKTSQKTSFAYLTLGRLTIKRMNPRRVLLSRVRFLLPAWQRGKANSKEGIMKRHLTLAAIAVALGVVGWGESSGVRAGETISIAFEQTEPVVSEAVAPSGEADAKPSGVKPAGAIESLAVEGGSTAVDGDAQGPADNDAQSESESTDGPAVPPVRIAEDGSEIEIIRERYPNQTVKIEREVTQDSNGNYVNHGSWKMWDAQGTLVVEGQYQNGERIGVWNRWYRSADVELLKTAPYSSFRGPYISQASFDLGQLNGKWIIFDSHQHRISEWEFVDGQRHGNFTWWYPNGMKMRECQYEGGEMHGKLMEWAPNARLVSQATYEHGRKLGSRTEKHRSGGNKNEGSYLFAREVVQTPDDWWNAKPAVYTKQGKDERHGHWIAWYPNGQKQTEGEYDHDIQVGEFTWWFANGQRALQGAYIDGEQQGKWVWWHENGQKSIQGDYRQGHPIGQWSWWNDDGKVARASKLQEGAGAVVQTPTPQPKTTPTVPQTASRASGGLGQPSSPFT
jgi:uncharacterized protein